MVLDQVTSMSKGTFVPVQSEPTRFPFLLTHVPVGFLACQKVVQDMSIVLGLSGLQTPEERVLNSAAPKCNIGGFAR